MRLIDDEQPNLGAGHGLREGGGAEALRGHVEQTELTGAGPLDSVGVGPVAPLGVDQRHPARGDPLKRGDLILHEGDEGRDDQGQVLAHERRELVAERLARSGRHDHQRVALAQGSLDGLGLTRTKRLESEQLTKRGTRVHGAAELSAGLGRCGRASG